MPPFRLSTAVPRQTSRQTSHQTPRPATAPVVRPRAWRALMLALVLLTASVLWAPRAARAAEAPAVLTLLEGEGTLVVGARAFAAAPGARLPAGTLIETEPGTGLLRIEWADGTLLDLGPATRVMLRPSGSKAAFYLLQGWAKHSQREPVAGHVSPYFEAAPFAGVLVSQLDDSGALVFSEAGGETLQPRRGGTALVLKGGQAAQAGAGAAAQLLARPPGAWLARVPRAFRESIPSRLAAHKGAPPTLKAKGPLTYAALRHWLQAEPLVRREMPQRMAELLADRAFRDAVADALPQHPEWEPLLKPGRASAVARRAHDNNPVPQEAPR